MKKRRLDEVLMESGKARNKAEAFIIVTEGRVTIDGQKAVTPAQVVSPSAVIHVREVLPYVGRGAYKLAAALDAFPVVVAGKICLDAGAATGGFTQVLLERGAVKVYAIDTARGKLEFKIRQDVRVVVMEETDVRDLVSLPESVGPVRNRTPRASRDAQTHQISNGVDLAVMDISLISLRDILPSVRRLLHVEGSAVALFKPQYETRDPSLLRRGIVRDDETREQLRADFMTWAMGNGWRIAHEITSPIRGSKGNTEYLFHLIPKA